MQAAATVCHKMLQETIRKQKYLKHAVLISYCGTGYYGLQRNKGYETIEEEILRGLLKSEQITQAEYDEPYRLYFQRAARTDKGVSAARQVLSINLPKDFPEKIPQVNECLPPKVRIMDAVRVTKYFDSKNYCDGRTYSYLMPTYALAPLDVVTNELYRVTPEVLKEFNEVLSKYTGTHNFHNFTSKIEATDAAARRYILEMEAGQPFMGSDLEFIVVRVRGQSFMMHQIRKMIGLAIAVVRGHATINTITDAFGVDRIDIPRAPGLGLMLEEPHYVKYNQRYGGDGVHDPISWDGVADRVFAFKRDIIHKEMVETEKNEHSMMKWLETLILHTYDSSREPGPPGSTQESEKSIYSKPYFAVRQEMEEKLKKEEAEEAVVDVQNDVKEDNGLCEHPLDANVGQEDIGCKT